MPNPYVNKVVQSNGTTLIDISDTTALVADVAAGKYFYLATGEKVEGSGSGGGGGPSYTLTTILDTTVTPSGETTNIGSGTLVAGAHYLVTVNGTKRINTAVITDGNLALSDQDYNNSSTSVSPWIDNINGNIYFSVKNYNSTFSVKIEKLELNSSGGGGGGGSTLIEKSITANGTYNASDDSADGYSKVTVNVSSGSSKNTQTVQSTTRLNNTALGSITSLTCSKAGTYDVYWSCARSSTSGTWGSQLYINGVAYDTENTTFTNHVQVNHLSNVTIPANATVAVYGRSRSGYYIYAPQLTIVEA